MYKPSIIIRRWILLLWFGAVCLDLTLWWNGAEVEPPLPTSLLVAWMCWRSRPALEPSGSNQQCPHLPPTSCEAPAVHQSLRTSELWRAGRACLLELVLCVVCFATARPRTSSQEVRRLQPCVSPEAEAQLKLKLLEPEPQVVDRMRQVRAFSAKQVLAKACELLHGAAALAAHSVRWPPPALRHDASAHVVPKEAPSERASQ
mmetsp:Transcript_38369/g.90183  ORF Transcript_38369/g.90183 Transcript_38369/m.90183 type:complete len:203 (+) Transcript_38369:58-666(+)